MDKWIEYVAYAAKAVVTAVVVALTFLTSILSDKQTFADVTPVQWMICALWVAAAFGFTYAIPNGPKPVAFDPNPPDHRAGDAVG